jgi:hypothetical protein
MTDEANGSFPKNWSLPIRLRQQTVSRQALDPARPSLDRRPGVEVGGAVTTDRKGEGSGYL